MIEQQIATAPRSLGIYKIQCDANGKCYVGKSGVIQDRWRQHLRLLVGNRHDVKAMQADFNKYGKQGFSAIVLEPLPNFKAEDFGTLIKEWEWTQRLSPAYGGAVGSPQGRIESRYKRLLRDLKLAAKKQAKAEQDKALAEELMRFAKWAIDYPPNWYEFKLAQRFDQNFAEQVIYDKLKASFKPSKTLRDFVRRTMCSYVS